MLLLYFILVQLLILSCALNEPQEFV